MIDIHLHWAWLLVAAVIVIGVCIAFPFMRDRDEGICGATGYLFGCMIIVLSVVAGIAIGGIFIW